MINRPQLDRALNPRTVAVVGDKQDGGYMWLNSLKTFKGRLYSVQVDPNEIPNIEALGVTNYKSLVDIPEEIDYVLVAVPRNVAPRILRDCIQKQVGGAAFFSSGFAETATEEGRELQKAMTQMAQEAGLMLIGPNCMGLFNPRLGVRFSQDQYSDQWGPVTFVSQSGSHAGSFAVSAYAGGVMANKVLSYGNGIVLNEADYLEYFAADPETTILGMYIEGARDGRRFFDQLRQAASQKPIVIWKGGQTNDGQRATASHTGSLAESSLLWDALLRQCGAIRADNLDETVDAVKALHFLPPLLGTGVGLTGGAGGQSVSMTDAFAKAGMSVPRLTESSYERLASFFSTVGASYQNPIDIGSNLVHLPEILSILIGDPNIHVLVMQLTAMWWARRPEILEGQINALAEVRQTQEKPVVAVLLPAVLPEHYQATQFIDDKLREAGIPSFPSYDRAATALKKIAGYYQFHRGD